MIEKNAQSPDDEDKKIVEELLGMGKATSASPSKEGEPVAFRPIIPDGGWGWMVVIGSFFIHVFADGFVYSFGIILVELLETFHEGRALTSWIVSILVGLTLGTGPIASAVTNTYGCRFTTMLGGLIAAAGCAASAFATSIVYLLVSVGLVMGIGFGLMYVPAIVAVTMYFDQRRAFATGIAVCGAGAGTFIFAPLSSLLIDYYGWRGSFLIYSGIMLNCVACGALFRPIPVEPIYAEELEQMQELELRGATPPHTPTMVHRDTSTSLDKQKEKQQNGKVPDIVVHTSMKMDNGMVVQLEPVNANEGDANPSNLNGSKSHSQSTTMENMRAYPRRQAFSVLGSGHNMHQHVHAGTRVLRQMGNLSLLKEPLFILFVISNFLTNLGLNPPLIFLPDKAERLGFDKLTSSWIISAFGAYVCLTSVLLVDALGLDKLTNAFGLLLLFQGVATLAGAPIGGSVTAPRRDLYTCNVDDTEIDENCEKASLSAYVVNVEKNDTIDR